MIDLEILESSVFGLVDGADVVVLDDVDVPRREQVVEVELDAVDVTHVAHAVRHQRQRRRHYAVVHLVLQPCVIITELNIYSISRVNTSN